AARLYAAAFNADPKLAGSPASARRYSAARAAALAADEKGGDAAKLDAKDRSRLRQQALDWLRDDFKIWAKLLDGDNAKARAAAQKTLQQWQRDPDLAGVRDAKALARLPEDERAAWRELWDEVAKLLKQ